MDSEPGVVADTLFLGITRPALALGVPYAALLANALLTLELFLATKNLLCLLLCLPLHGLAWLACLAEPRFFDLVAVWGQVRMRGGVGGSRQWCVRTYGCLRGAGREESDLATVIVEAREAGR